MRLFGISYGYLILNKSQNLYLTQKVMQISVLKIVSSKSVDYFLK
jgi:hypothetical protein